MQVLVFLVYGYVGEFLRKQIPEKCRLRTYLKHTKK